MSCPRGVAHPALAEQVSLRVGDLEAASDDRRAACAYGHWLHLSICSGR
jgi:hypothetical protein